MKHPRAFTLIEMLVYTALVASIMTAVVLLTVAMLNTRGQARGELVLNENMEYLLYRLGYQIHEATGITTPSGTGSSSSTLILTMASSTLNPTTIRLTNGTATLAQGASATAYVLTSSEIEITALTFTRASGTPASVKIDVAGRVRNATSTYQTSVTLSSFATVRR